jgi:hypothetical protein
LSTAASRPPAPPSSPFMLPGAAGSTTSLIRGLRRRSLPAFLSRRMSGVPDVLATTTQTPRW